MSMKVIKGQTWGQKLKWTMNINWNWNNVLYTHKKCRFNFFTGFYKIFDGLAFCAKVNTVSIIIRSHNPFLNAFSMTFECFENNWMDSDANCIMQCKCIEYHHSNFLRIYFINMVGKVMFPLLPMADSGNVCQFMHSDRLNVQIICESCLELNNILIWSVLREFDIADRGEMVVIFAKGNIYKKWKLYWVDIGLEHVGWRLHSGNRKERRKKTNRFWLFRKELFLIESVYFVLLTLEFVSKLIESFLMTVILLFNSKI